MWAWLWQVLPSPPDDFTRTDRLVILGLVAAVVTPTWLAWWNARIAKKATRPDSGNSLADKLTRIETQADRIEVKADVHTMALDVQRKGVAELKTGLADHRTEVNKIVRELRHDIDGIRSDVHDLQETQTHRRETVQTEEGTTQ